jgi:prophage antirepressor-like protein
MKTKNEIQEFHSDEFGAIEILMIGGKPYFPATECANILGYKNPQKAIRDHCKGVNESFTPSSGGVQKKNFIPEGDLYRLIARSKLPAAERFEAWVFDEVLPTIRKYGAYATEDTLGDMLRSPEFTDRLLRALDAEREKNATLIGLAEEMAPKALYYDAVLQNKGSVPVSLIAKDYGMAAAAFNNLLHGLGVQYKMSGTWLLYQRYAAQGYTNTCTFHINETTAAMHTYWTQKGRMFLYDLLKWYGILPMIEKRADMNWR